MLVALFSRRPSLLTQAQFYAEDGMIWFAEAYNLGWLRTLFLPQVGYLTIVPRLGSGLALLVPLRWAPLVMNILGMLIQVLPVPILLSSRCRNWASLPTRILLALFMLPFPVPAKFMWCSPMRSGTWLWQQHWWLLPAAHGPGAGDSFDIVLLLMASLTGPYAIVLAPLVLGFWWVRRQTWTLAVLAVTGLSALTQIVLLPHTHRVQGTLGASPELFLRMLGGNVVACAMFGSLLLRRQGAPAVQCGGGLRRPGYLFLFFAEDNPEWRLFLIFCGAVYAASLLSPLTGETKPAWELLVERLLRAILVFPMLAFVWAPRGVQPMPAIVPSR